MPLRGGVQVLSQAGRVTRAREEDQRLAQESAANLGLVREAVLNVFQNACREESNDKSHSEPLLREKFLRIGLCRMDSIGWVCDV